MADITSLIALMKLRYKEQMEKQERQHAEQIEKQERQHAEQMAVLIAKVKSRDADMKHLVEAARDGAKESSTPVASFEPFDSSSELWLDYLERFRTFLTANSIPKEKEAELFITNKTTVTYKLHSNLAAQQSPSKGINDLSMDDIQKFMGKQFDPRRFVVRERYRFWSDVKR